MNVLTQLPQPEIRSEADFPASQEKVSVSRMEFEGLLEENRRLAEQIQWLQRQLFGKRSERSKEENPDVLYLPGFEFLKGNEESAEKVTVPEHERVKKRKSTGLDKISYPDDLTVVRTVLDLPEDQKVDPATGAPLVQIGEDITRKLGFKPGSYFIREIVRLKYAVNGAILAAPTPEGLFDRCQGDESLLADVVVRKFADHLPLYRQNEIMKRDGINISRQTLSQWVVRCGQALKPLYDELLRHILQSECVFIDETPVKMLEPGKGKTHSAYMWTIVGGKAADPAYRVYSFRTNRRHCNAFELLSGFKGVVHSDKYGAYTSLAGKQPIVWCPCWAHVRRKFFEAESGDPVFRRWILRKIKYLYMLERVAWARPEEERLRIRTEKEKPIIDEILEAVKNKQGNIRILPKSKLREALNYCYNLASHLGNYLKDPWAHIDNNPVERAIRPLAIGRKNWLFVGNEVGGESAAVLLSLIQTCRALDINPREYLEDVMRRLMSHSANRIQELLPDRWAASRR